MAERGGDTLDNGQTIQVVQFLVGGFFAFLPARAVVSLGTRERYGGDDSSGLGSDRFEGGPATQRDHLSSLLGFEPSPDPDAERLLSLVDRSAGTVVRVRVDGPVTFRKLASTDLLRMPVGVERVNRGPVIAVTELDGALGYVFDPQRLFALVQGATATDIGSDARVREQ